MATSNSNLIGKVIKSRTSLYIEDVNKEEFYNNGIDLHCEIKYPVLVCIPIHSIFGKISGVLQVFIVYNATNFYLIQNSI